MKKFLVAENKKGELCEYRKNLLTGKEYYINKHGEEFEEKDMIKFFWI